MQADEVRKRRLGGGHITLIVIAVCALLMPAVAYAAQRVISVIGDPHDSSALARVSQDGHLAVRGEVTSQQGVPANEWHASRSASPRDGWLLQSAPAGSGIGVSQLSIHWSQRGNFALVVLYWLAVPSGEPCRDRAPLDTAGLLQRLWFTTRGVPDGGEQRLFPVPLTVPPSRDRNVCLYAWGGLQIGPEADDFTPVSVDANGVTGPALPAFKPPKGTEPAPVPDEDVKPG